MIAFLAAPFVFLALLGVYAAFIIIHGVITFNRSETEQKSLMKDLKMAEVALRRLGFDFEKFGIPTS